MARMLVGYGAALALGAFALSWLEYQYLVRFFPTEIYIVLIALGFTALGIWAGYRLTPDRRPFPFQRNDKALSALGITPRETEILGFLATGQTNKQIARSLGKAPDTVKSHVASLLRKLEATTRTEAIARARDLGLIP